MNKIPTTVTKYLHHFYITRKVPTYLQINTQGNLIGWSGQPHYYGLTNLVIGKSATDQIPLLEGLLPATQPEVLEFVKVETGKSAYIHILPAAESTWVLFIDASAEAEQRRQVQQQSFELALSDYRHSQLIQELEVTYQALLRKNDQFERTQELTSQFVTTLTQVLRTSPLSEASYSELLADIQRAYLRKERTLSSLKNEIHHLLMLIGKALKQSESDIERVVLQPTGCQVRGLIAELESLFLPEALEKGLIFEISINHNIPEFLLIDELRFRQVLINLLTNAFKFTPKGFVELRLSWQANRLKFKVNDSGPGITQEAQPRVFTPYYRDQTISSNAGLGLAVSRHLVELMGGKLQVQSLPQLGATFIGIIAAPIISLPPQDLVESELETDAEVPITKVTDLPKKITPRILVVDDSMDLRNLLKIYLADNGYEVVTANNGPEAVSLVWQTEPEVILIAMQLALMDGYETVKELRFQLFSKPIMALLNEEDDKDLALQAGCNHYLTKPIWKEDLLIAVAQILAEE